VARVWRRESAPTIAGVRAVGLERRAALGLPGTPVLALVAAAPLTLAVARLLPADGVGLALRLAAAAACVVVLPGALVVRALGAPLALGVAAAAALAWSLAAVFLALALTFAAGGSIALAALVVAAVAVAALVPALRARPKEADRPDVVAAAAVAAAGVVFGAAIWWAAGPVDGDGLFHLARARKLAELDALSSVQTVNEFRDGGLHPGYAFPLWHGVLALVATLGGVDVAEVVRYAPAALAPLAALMAYGAGFALFRSWEGGVAVAAVSVALAGFARGGVGSFEFLSLPASASLLLLVPAVLALAFAFVRDGGRPLLASLAAAAFALAVVHPTYALFVALPLGGFLVARMALARDGAGALRIAASLAAVLVPSTLFFAWLLPVVRSTASHRPDAGERERALSHYATQLDLSGDWFRLAPENISRGGALAVGGLLAVPLAALAARRLWAAFVLGGSLAVLAVLLVPPLFTAASDLVSLSQSRRLTAFVPLPFALAGAALLAGRLKVAGAALALAAAIVLRILYPGDFGPRLEEGGPAWPVWTAALGGAVALVAGALARRSWEPRTAPRWSAAAALALVVPLAVAGAVTFEREPADPWALPAGLVGALRAEAAEGDVVFSDLETSYRVAAYAPVYVNAASPAHVADTDENRPYERREDVLRFFSRPGVDDRERRRLLAAYGADWLVVDKERRYPESFVASLERVYEDDRHALFRVRSR
jgi:hypothetical protein